MKLWPFFLRELQPVVQGFLIGMEEKKGYSPDWSPCWLKVCSPPPHAHSFLMKQACNLIT